MKIITLDNAEKVASTLDGRIMGQSDTAKIIHIRLSPGEKIESHRNENDAFFYVIEGKAMLTSDQEPALLTRNQCVFIEGGTQRGFDNISVGDFKMIAIKLPD
ncbi:MAG: cupin domain-containing protein [Lentimicrobium sp.]|jgi:mannose-6-phosphate isomerase-like protein (cupin superfamily)|nr:cupin domain-containing protein [Lentimicrobium sp.]MDD2529286.1 cupin domain-containing protein [Lentimicrobiaceae bacterium]MDD4598717.1 cupin domain-containing protein [Lentimicrobiaceae bacterium]MDY0026471.1 cupin domain-containing protein [Lentimicrobium sp.]